MFTFFVCARLMLGRFWKRTNTKLQILLLERKLRRKKRKEKERETGGGGKKECPTKLRRHQISSISIIIIQIFLFREDGNKKKHCFGLFLSQVLQVSQVQVRFI